MTETRKLTATLVADVVGYSRLAGIDEERTLARLRTLRSDLIDSTVSVHHGRIVKRTGDGGIVEFRSVVDAVRCAVEVQTGLKERNSDVPPEKRIEFRIGIHVGDVVDESDGDLMGDGVNIAARLEAIAKPGGICLSEDAWRHAQGKVEARFIDAGEQRLKNIAPPVRAFLWAPGEAAAPRPTPSARSLAAALGIGGGREPAGTFLRRSKLLIGLLILVAFAASAAWVRIWPTFQGPGPIEPLSPVAQRSIAVLPFRNMSGDKEQDYFADGLSDDLITRLSQTSDLSVIARSSMSAFKDKSVEPQEVGQKLGARYVLEGSVQKSSDRMRINENLIEASDARQIWAEQFDEGVSNIFDVQDKVINRIVSALKVRLTDVEQSKLARAPTKNLEAYDYYLRAENEGYYDNLRAITRALAFYGRAIELDPNFADAQAGYALTASKTYFARSKPMRATCMTLLPRCG
jgi:adenylate cyclase